MDIRYCTEYHQSGGCGGGLDAIAFFTIYFFGALGEFS